MDRAAQLESNDDHLHDDNNDDELLRITITNKRIYWSPHYMAEGERILFSWLLTTDTNKTSFRLFRV